MTCTCSSPCATRSMHRLHVGELQAVETMRVLLQALESVARRFRGDRR